MKNCEPYLRVAAPILLAISISGCAKNPPSTDLARGAKTAHSGGKLVDMASAGSVTGTVRFDGVPPQPKTINMIDVPNCAKMHATPVLTEAVVPGDGGTLQNAVVYLEGDFSVYSFPQSDEAVKVDQRGCIYTPHVAAVMTGDALEVTNADSVTHNINVISKYHQGWNETQVSGSAHLVRRFAREEIPMTVKCTMHPWMRFYVAVFDHPYFQVTGKDGKFVLRNVPPGTYTLAVWHETYGTKKQTVVIQPKLQQTVSLTFTAKDR